MPNFTQKMSQFYSFAKMLFLLWSAIVLTISLSGQYNTIKKNLSIKRPTLLSDRCHLSAVPIRVFLLFLYLLNGHQTFNTLSLVLF